MKQEEINFLLSQLNFIPQVSLLVGPKRYFKLVVDSFLKRIICQKQSCVSDDLCYFCQKLKDNCYFDLNSYQFNKNNLMKKQDVFKIINDLSHQSIENNNPRICVVEGIENSSPSASNIFLKFLEAFPSNVFLIFVSANIEKILPTIKSRCQIIDFFIPKNYHRNNDFLICENDLLVIKKIIAKFIIYDNKKQTINNFFLIKELVNSPEKVLLFFQVLLLLTNNKMISNINMIAFKNNADHEMIKELLATWNNHNYEILISLSELLNEVITTVNNIKNINLNLLLNYFFINYHNYQGQKNEGPN